MTTRLGFDVAKWHDHPCLTTIAGGILLAGHVGIGEALSTYFMIFPPIAGAIFGGCFAVGGTIVWAIDYITDATACFGTSNLAQITRAALYAILGSTIAIGVVSLAGFSIVIMDVVQLAGFMMLVDSTLITDAFR